MFIRKATQGDVGELLKMEQACFENAWGEESILSEMQKAFCEIFIAEKSGAAGFLLLYKIGDEAEIVRIGVPPEYRRQGIARALLYHALQGFSGAVYLEVRESNLPAVLLYENMGFKKYAVRKSYYENPAEDALLLKKQCPFAQSPLQNGGTR